MRPLRILAAVGLLAGPIAPSSEAGTGFPANQPFASYWFPNELLAWNPLTDPDAVHNRGTVPLADRFTNPATQVNGNARDGEALVVALNVMYPSTSNNPSQGAATFGVHALGFWQYLDLLVFWGGSAGEGLILAPSADVIDSGHRNGVPVLGTVFFPPNVFGGQIQWVHDFVQENAGVYPVADKLIEAATHYGFDGWFINQETDGGDSTLALQMQGFLEYFQANKPPGMHMMWYDAMIDDGNVAWQNQLNDRNLMFFEDDGRVSDSIFLNFGWGSGTRLADSRAVADSVGRSPYDVFAGINVQALGYNANPQWPKLFPDSTVHTTSVGFFGGEWTYTSSTDPADYYARQNTFWVGQNRDPSNTTTVDDWKGQAHYVPAKSALNDVPWVTSFNTGQGFHYSIEGEVLRSEEWNHRSLQDVLPTWRWIAESAGTPLFPEIDFTDSYDGGSCLKVSGALDPSSTTHLKLYKTSLLVPAGGAISLAYRTGEVGASSMQVGLSFETDPDAFVFLDVDSTTSTGWNPQTIDLSAHVGKTVAVMSLRFETTGSIPDYEMRIGRLGLIEGAADVPAAPTAVTLDDLLIATNLASASLRMSWTASPDPTHHYRVYRVNPDDSREYLGGTPNTAYFVAHLARAAAETTTVLEVEAVSPEFGRSLAGTTSVYWGPDPPNELAIANANGPYCGGVGDPLAFHSDGSFDPDGTIVSWLWHFGDGDSSTAANPVHAYLAPGDYEVILTVTDDLARSAFDTTSATITAVASDLTPEVVWYPLDEGSGTVAGDSTGNGLDGAVNGPQWVAGVDGSALDFDGIDDHVIVSDYVQSGAPLTVTGWAYAHSLPQWGSIVKNWANQTGAFHLGLYESDGDFQVDVTEADENVVSLREGAGTPLPTGEWHHVAVVADAAEVSLYRNGKIVDRVDYDGTLKTSRPGLGIGVKLNNAGTIPSNSLPSYWHGILDDVRIYDRALCQSEIERLRADVVTVAPDPARPGVPLAFALSANHPNPFGPATDLRYAVAREAHVALSVYDVAGRKVVDLVNERQPAGSYRVSWRGRNASGQRVAAGVYFARMTAGEFTAVRKMLVLR